MPKTVSQSTVKGIQHLVNEGDIILADERAKLNGKVVTDAQLIIAIAATEDDDDELLNENVDLVLKGELTVS